MVHSSTHTAAAAVATVETAYDLDLTTSEWLRSLALATRRSFEFDCGTQAVLYAKRGGSFSAVAHALLNSPGGFDHYVTRLAHAMPLHGQEFVARLPPGAYAYSQTDIGREVPNVFSNVDGHITRNVLDWGALVASTGSAFVILGGLSTTFIEIRTGCDLWRRVARHIRIGLALRSAISDGTLNAEAVVSPDGDVKHAVGPCSDSGPLRAQLRDAVRRREGARRSRTKGNEFLSLWPGLIDGRLILIDRFDTDGRRYVVAVQSVGVRACDRELTSREREVVSHAMDGSTNREIAKKLGISVSTVSSHISNALLKLRLARRESLPIEACAHESHVERVSLGPGLSVVFESKPIEPSPLPGLTVAENAILCEIFRGLSNAEIAEVRRRSQRTVANQVAEILFKLDVRNRAELVSQLVRHWPRGIDHSNCPS